MNKIYKLIFESYGEIVSEDFFFHKENASREAHRLIARAMGIRASEVKDVDVYDGGRVVFFDMNTRKQLKDIYIDVIMAMDEV